MSDLDDDLNEAGRKLFAPGADYLLSVHRMDDLLPIGPVEVAFAGRSNVGKSSLINALTNRRRLAHTSNTPGRTQALNFYRISDDLTLVDMPGYGFARAPKDAVKAWTALIRAYLRGRPSLRRVFVLVDARHGLKDSDIGIMDLLDQSAVSYQVVLTKVDKLRSSEVGPLVEKTAARLANRPAAYPLVLATSAEKGDGMDALREAIAELCRQRGIVVPA